MKQLLTKEKWPNKKYSVGIANTKEELDELYRLRFDIFNIELDEGIPENVKTKKDIDEFDKYCDHLIIKHDNKIIATYRMHPSWKMDKKLGFYTATEFDISKLELEKGKNLEMGRACIHPEHRGNMLILALWFGIREYCFSNKVEKLFGVASIPRCSEEDLVALYNHLSEKGFVVQTNLVKSLNPVNLENKGGVFNKELISSLLKGYLKLGAKIYGEPVYDPIFRCYDLLIILDIKHLDWSYLESIAKVLFKA